MTLLKQEKYVSALPGTLEAHTIYYVRVGAGFDMYITNAAAAAIPLNTSSGGGVSYSECFVRNSDTTHNINPASWTECPINGIVDHIDSAAFTISGNGVQCNFTGRLSGHTHVGYTVSGARVNAKARLNIFDGAVYTPQDIQGKSGYVRNSGGHNESSPNMGQSLFVNNGDIITVETLREAGAATTTMDAGGCFLWLQRWA